MAKASSRADRDRLRRAAALFVVGVLALAGVQVYLRLAAAPTADERWVAAAREPGPLRVVVSIPPLLWPVRAMLPADTEITLLVPPGASEHGYELTPSQIAAIHHADVIAMVGLGLEPRLEQIVSARRVPWRQVVTFAGLGEAIEHHDHAPHPGHENCEHGVFDPHMWLEPPAMAAYAARLAQALTGEAISTAARLADGSPALDASPVLAAASRIEAECAAMDAEYRAALAGLSSRRIVTHHNAFAYIARRYGLEVAAVIRPIVSVEPTPGEIDDAVNTIRAGGMRAIFVEPQFSIQGARRIAEVTGVKKLTLDPLGDGDWPGMMRANLSALVEGLGGAEARAPE